MIFSSVEWESSRLSHRVNTVTHDMGGASGLVWTAVSAHLKSFLTAQLKSHCLSNRAVFFLSLDSRLLLHMFVNVWSTQGRQGWGWVVKRKGGGGGGGLSVLSDTHFEVNTLRSMKACLLNMHCYHAGSNRMFLLSYFLTQPPWADSSAFLLYFLFNTSSPKTCSVVLKCRMYLHLINVQ